MLKTEPKVTAEQQIKDAKALRKGTFINKIISKCFSVIMNRGAKQVSELLDSSPDMAVYGQCIHADNYDAY